MLKWNEIHFYSQEIWSNFVSGSQYVSDIAIEMVYFIELFRPYSKFKVHFVRLAKIKISVHIERNKRTMMVLYRSPEYIAVQVNNEDKYQTDY